MFGKNFTATDKKNFAPVPPGFYEVEIFDAATDQALTGTDFINVDFLIVQGEYSNRHLWTHLYLTDKAMWKVEALLNAVGLKPSDDLKTDDLIGKRLRVRVRHGQDQDGNVKVEVIAFRRSNVDPIPF